MARVGESVAFSAGTVIAALLTLLLATFGLYSSLGAPLAIAIALMLLAALTLLPALLAIFGRAAFWPSRTARGAGRSGWWGRTAGRIVAHPAATLILGIVGFGALATAAIGYTPAGFGGAPPAPAGSDSAAGTAGDPGSNAALGQVPAIRAAVAAVARDVGARSYGVSGEAPATYDISRVSDHDLLRIVPVAIVVIALLLALVMRSLVAPVYLIASVALSYLAAFGLSVLLFQDAVLPGTGGSGGLPYFVPFLMFLFLLALGE